jgi:RNA polymerase primary sigma factor
MIATASRKTRRPSPASSQVKTKSATEARAVSRTDEKGVGVSRQPSEPDHTIGLGEVEETSPDYIFHESFLSLSDADVFEVEELKAPVVKESATVKANAKLARTMPNSLFRLCAAPLLSPKQEEALFRAMNYARYQIAVLRRKPLREKTKQRIAWYETQACSFRNRIVQANTRLVASIARQFANKHYTFDDLLSEGIETLLRSVDKFDFGRGFRFSTYATLAIRRSLYRYLQHRHLDDQRFARVESTLINDAEDQPVESSMSEHRWMHLQKCLKTMLGRLEPRERHILRQRFGLDQSPDVTTLQSLAKELGVCKERVRQLEQRAIARLREMAEKMEVTSGRE